MKHPFSSDERDPSIDPPGTNGCSVPNLFRPLLPEEPLEQHLVCDGHDEMYHAGGNAADRLAADDWLRDNLIAVGMPTWKAWIYWVGVRLGGWSHWRR